MSGSLFSKRGNVFALVLCFLMMPQAVLASEKNPVGERHEIEIISGSVPHKFQVEIANTREELARGLMFRRELGEDNGMLFKFDPPRFAHIWMKNTFIPLDVLFFNEEGVLHYIHENAVPMSLETIGLDAEQRTSYVLELAGGAVARTHLKVGDRLHLTEAEVEKESEGN